jgi:hypothetical protein
VMECGGIASNSLKIPSGWRDINPGRLIPRD